LPRSDPADGERSAGAPAPGRRFPEGFRWGVGTSSYQIEGAVHAGGRSPSIWDTFAHAPGAVANGDTGDVADDHYHRYGEDVETLAALGARCYRLSVAWPRLQPTGRGPLHRRGVDFYRRVLDATRERGIEPWVTLYHWDLPQALQDLGGWPARDTAARFADYAARVHAALGDEVSHWITVNEPWCAAFLGHASGTHAPGVTDPMCALRAAHHLLLGHGLAVDAMRAQARPGDRYGIALNLQPVLPAGPGAPAADAARRIDGLANRWFLDALLLGTQPADVVADLAGWATWEHVEPGDLATIATPLDFLGINYYTRQAVCADAPRPPSPTPWVGSPDVGFVARDLPLTAMGWEIDPDGLRDVLIRVASRYPTPPLYVTENGAAFDDDVRPDGSVDDAERIAYLSGHLAAAHEAIAAGVDLRGWFAWTLLDNFEWEHGFDRRFGLVHVDFATQRRTPKRSAAWYAGVMRRNGLPAAARAARDPAAVER
jgi:beta-glucosidase